MSLLSHFLKQSSGHFKREGKKAFQMDELLGWRREMLMYKFGGAQSLESWTVGSDEDIGGHSKAKLELNPSGTAKFHGSLSSHMPEYLEVKINSYAAFKSKPQDYGYFGVEVFDTLPFRYLALRVKGSDGKNGSPPPRKFTVNVQTDGLIPTDLYQHRLFLNRPGQWETVLIPFDDFVLTNDGAIEAHQATLFREQVKAVGISLLDRQPGPFQLEIDWIKALNTDFTDGDVDQVISID